MKFNLDTFISGTNVDLCIPDENFANKSNWYTFLNKKKINNYLELFGNFPNTKKNQIEFLRSSQESSKIVLVALSKDKNSFYGIVSLSAINFMLRRCAISFLFDSTSYRSNILIPLESVSLLTEHAIQDLGVDKVEGFQHVDLHTMTEICQLIGYKIESIQEDHFVKGRRVEDTVHFACIYKDIQTIKKKRNGLIWDSNEAMFKRIKKLRKIESFYETLRNLNKNNKKEIYKKIFDI